MGRKKRPLYKPLYFTRDCREIPERIALIAERLKRSWNRVALDLLTAALHKMEQHNEGAREA